MEDKKKMRKEALIGLSVLLVAVSGSATVLDSFGVVSGETSVEGPTLWATSGNSLVSDEADVSSVGAYTNVTNGENEYEFFKLDRINANTKWYEMEPEIFVELRSEEPNGEAVNVTVTFGNYGEADRSCESTFEVEGSEYDIYSTENTENFDCKIDTAPEGNLELRVEMDDTSEEARINYTGDTKIEVNAR